MGRIHRNLKMPPKGSVESPRIVAGSTDWESFGEFIETGITVPSELDSTGAVQAWLDNHIKALISDFTSRVFDCGEDGIAIRDWSGAWRIQSATNVEIELSVAEEDTRLLEFVLRKVRGSQST